MSETENVVTKPLILDETGKRMAVALETMAARNASEISTSWAGFKQVARRGTAKQVYNIGDIFSDTWTDTVTGTDYTYDWRIIDLDKDYEDASGNTTPGTMLEMRWAHPFGVQFSHQQAFLLCPDGLPAGTYHLTLGSNWGSNAVKDKVYQFTIATAVEKGQKLAGFYGMPDQAPANWKVYVYSADGKTIAQDAVAVTEGSDGTDLGTMAYNTHTENIALTIDGSTYNVTMNSMQETAYGHNRWRDSALRQYLNSDKAKGLWWTAQNDFDIIPDQAATKDGFLCGLPSDMLNAIRTIKVTTYANTVQDGGGADVTYDKVFPLALEQMYINPQISGEGDATEYYTQLNGTSTKWAQYGTYPALIRYAVENHASAQGVRLRSAIRGYANYAWLVYSSGYVYNNYASNAFRFCPACVIG